MPLLPVLLGLAPVLFFLTALVLVDTYQLVRFRSVLAAVGAGAVAAGGAWLLSAPVAGVFSLDPAGYRVFAAPLLEEALKAAWLLFLVQRNRVGFTIDAAILGFAVGAGFACAENLYYIGRLGASDLAVWVVRGFGTAVMHGGTAAAFAILAKLTHDAEARYPLRWYGAALVAATVIHALHNLFVLPPTWNMLAVLTGSTVTIGGLITVSERRTRSWLGTGFDTDQELLELLMTGRISDSRIGAYLRRLRVRFPGPVVADMLCLIRLRVELSLRAKGLLMMREAGFEVKVPAEIRDRFDELRYLERSIGRVGLLAIEPIHRWSRRDLFQLTLLDRS